jgi:hypothetical protein
MDKKRKAYAPFSLTSEAGVAQTPVEGYIDVNQVIYPTVNTGTVNENGKWVGVKASDTEFLGLQTVEAVADSTAVLFPDTQQIQSIDMVGFSDIFIALKSTNTGNLGVRAVSGPDTEPFANLTLSPGITYKGNYNDGTLGFEESLVDSTENISVANEFFVFMIQNRCRNYRNLQFRIANSQGAPSDITFGFLRMV